MGMLIDDPHGVADVDMYSYWETQLKNDKVLLNQIDRAIAVLMQRVQTADGVCEYTIDTGQDRQTVKTSDIPSLIQWKKDLLAEINQLSNALYGNRGWSQVIPGY